MPHNHEWLTRIKSVEREYLAIRQAAGRFQHAARVDPTILIDNLRHADIVDASQNLEGTYLIRLFAVFETGVRQYWETRRKAKPKTVDLLNGVAARCRIPDVHRVDAHLVRDYRNSLVHEREDGIKALPIADARRYLCRFFGHLPPQW